MGTIRISPRNKSRLASLKETPGESFDSVINRLIDFYDDPLTREDIQAIRESLEDLKHGRVFTHEEVKEKLGLTDEKPFTVLYTPGAVKDLEELSDGESSGMRHSEPCRDEMVAIKEYEKKKGSNARRPDPL
jgi:predicted transcriptional regulator